MSCTVTRERVLDAYTRILDAEAGEWLSALAFLSRNDGLVLTGEWDSRAMGYVSYLPVGNGSVTYVETQQALHLTGHKNAHPTLLQIQSGQISDLDMPGLVLGPGDFLMLRPRQRLNLKSGSNTRLLAIQLFDAPSDNLVPGRNPVLDIHTQTYLDDAPFFCHNTDAVRRTHRLLGELRESLIKPTRTIEHIKEPIDPRVLRAVLHMRQNPDWPFNLAELAAIAYTSERNLYNLMRVHIGCTPYRYYQRCRLLRVRDRMVSHRFESSSISWYAMEGGFNHLGRFSALYREHFGELPSETLGWKKQLQAILQPSDIRRFMTH
ncbi:helix-turn-helix domain-containing protein [Saccharospirillum salsuginis]|uniref:helix-turn-helix domain-containing protein n=1 Tax=Saccharospirillum salsuginis TaxID=418750 RepID=UPI0016777448|nr:helix-turn-helix domain-containing protein [Saccharospirillum salsuginis]